MDNINRRNFIGKTALAGLGVIGAASLAASCKRQSAIGIKGLPPILRGAPKGKKLRRALRLHGGAGALESGAKLPPR